MKKFFIYLATLSSMSCSAPKQVTTKSGAINNPLEGTWVLSNVLMGDAMDAPCGFMNEGKIKEMNLTFTSEKGPTGEKSKLNGQSSVNTFLGNYTVLSYDKKTNTGKIELDALISTKMASVNPAFMECETRYLTYLQKVEDFKIEDGKLQLSKTYPLPKGDTGHSPFGDSYKNILYFKKKQVLDQK